MENSGCRRQRLTHPAWRDEGGSTPQPQQNLRGRVSTVWQHDVSPLAFDHFSHYSYDIHGNVTRLTHAFPELDHLQRYYDVSYAYDLVSGKVTEVEAPGIRHRYAYDADNRLTNVWTAAVPFPNRGGIGTEDPHHTGNLWHQDAKYFYYPHGPLARTELGHNKVQGIDHAYTAHGWLKALNSITLGPGNDMGTDAGAGVHNNIATDAFGLSLHYYTADYAPRAGSATPAFLPIDGAAWADVPSLFNGNIGRMATSVGTTAQGSLFHYDQLNRLTSAEHFSDLTTNTLGATANPTPDQSDHYSSYIYDSNGNIMALDRNGDGGSTINPMDRLTYTYSGTDNRLQRVDDQIIASPCSTDVEAMTTDFTYYRNGNLRNDPSANIGLMLWHPNGKLNAIIRDGVNESPTLVFSYDGLGNRVRKVQVARDASGNTLPMAQWDLTYYIRDAQGNHLTTIDRKFIETDEFEATDELNISETVLYGSDRLGTRGWVKSDDTYPASLIVRHPFTHSGVNESGEYQDITPSGSPVYSNAPEDYCSSLEGAKHYELKNHLGNVLATVSDKRDVEVDGSNNVQNYTAKISDVSFYYPFGSLMPGLSDFGGGHRFGFNGMEMDNEVRNSNGSSYDFGARMYNSQLGRWNALDPARRMYPGISGYTFAANSPIFLMDPNGKWVVRINTADDGGKALAFDPEPGDNLATLACQLGLPDGQVFDALRESGDLINLANGRSVSLQSLEAVKNINGYLNSNVEATNCANLALSTNGIQSTPSAIDGGDGSINKAIEVLGNSTNVLEQETRIGDVTTFQFTKEALGEDLMGSGMRELYPNPDGTFKSKSELSPIIDEQYGKQTTKHFSTVILKSQEGMEIQQSLEKTYNSPVRLVKGMTKHTDFESAPLQKSQSPHYRIENTKNE